MPVPPPDGLSHLDPLHREILEGYGHAAHVPLRGLYTGGVPALTRADPAEVGEYVILTVRDPLCGYDQDPAEQIAAKLDAPRLIGRSGMFSTFSGGYRGASVSVVSGGSGSPEAELVLHELMENTGATTYLRVGGSGGMHPRVRPGDLVIASGVVRDEGMTAAYVPPSWPAAADPLVVLALARAAHDSGGPYHIGTIRSTDSDFVAGGRPGVGGYLQSWHTTLVDDWARAGVLAGDRESAAVVTLARLFGRRGGAICSVADNISTGAPFETGAGHIAAIDVALEGTALLHRLDRAAEAEGLPMWLPRYDTCEEAR